MASTLYASRNEPDWGERKVYMRKNPNPNPAETTTSSSNPNPNPRPPAGDGPPYKAPHRGTPAAAAADPLPGGYVTYRIGSYSRSELRDLKYRLASELERVRFLSSWIETRSAGSSSPHHDATSSSASRPQPLRPQPPDHKKSAASGKRPPPPANSPRDAKISRSSGTAGAAVDPGALMKKCGQILTKLMKHKHGWVFNEPVDAVGMGLHDYNTIIKRPMDLGTVKSRLDANGYPSPLDFAADVRLTFNNALLYNPRGHDVYIMAEQLLRLFEDLFGPAREKYEKHRRAIAREHDSERHRNHQIPIADGSARLHPPVPSQRPPPQAIAPTKPDPTPAKPEPVAPPQKPLPAAIPPPQQIAMPPKAAPVVKQPKPKARDPHKREMSFREKQKLSQDLQMIPDEKMDQIVLIVRKRNPDPALDGNEIELDFEALDTETLWELDRFVSNCKKMMNKIKRQEAISAVSTAAAPAPPPAVPKADEVSAVPKIGVGETTPEAASAKKNRRPDAGEEDVDIGDAIPSTQFPPVEIEKDESSDSDSSSSESSSSSSSSDSDTRSSSGSDSDGDEAQSPAVGLRPPLQT